MPRYRLVVPMLEWLSLCMMSASSTLIGTFDQAALQGLLRRLHSLGLPLISVICVDFV